MSSCTHFPVTCVQISAASFNTFSASISQCDVVEGMGQWIPATLVQILVPLQRRGHDLPKTFSGLLVHPSLCALPLSSVYIVMLDAGDQYTVVPSANRRSM